MSQGCALYVPSREEIREMGTETRDFLDHPNFSRHEGLDLEQTTPVFEEDSHDLAMTAASVGTKLSLPKGTPRHYPPYAGARHGHAWGDRTLIQVHKVTHKAPGIICATYVGHGRTGIKWGIDAMVSPFGRKANSAQEEFGDRLCNWAIRNWHWLHLNYVIWWNWMNDGAGWFDYEPWRRQWPLGSQTLVSSRHLDHNHYQIDSPHLAGNE